VPGGSKRAKRGSWALWASEEEAMGLQAASGSALLHTRAQVPGVQARRGVQVGARIEENGVTREGPHSQPGPPEAHMEARSHASQIWNYSMQPV
ncbi:hypothetical protein QJQ45_016814, partial [Haematococcus lacustris]